MNKNIPTSQPLASLFCFHGAFQNPMCQLGLGKEALPLTYFIFIFSLEKFSGF